MRLWRRSADGLSVLWLRETPDPFHVGMIVRFPSCFRCTSGNFEDFVVSHLEVLFRRENA